VVFGAWLIQRGLATGELPLPVLPGAPTVINIIDLLPPPPIQPHGDPGKTLPEPETIVASATGVPEVVPDFQAPDIAYQSPDEWAREPIGAGPGNFAQADGPIVIIVPETDPDPGVFFPVEEEPYPIQNPAPVYPEMARAAEVEGVVLVRAMVNKEGRIEKAFVISGHPMLDEAALAAIRAWVFQPAMQQHRPVKVWVTVPIRFVLH
ncbi:MAG: TonB family protein, partial [bacterium]